MPRAALPILTLLLFLTTATSGHCAGYALYEWSARGNALGGAFAAKADDPSAIAFNPAGITQLEGSHFQAGAAFIAPNTNVTAETAAGTKGEGEGDIWTIPSAYYTNQLNDNVWIGLGMYSRVGLGSDYSDQETWFGRYNCASASIKATSLVTAFAWKVTDELSLAFAPEIIVMDFGYSKYTDVTMANNPATTANDVRQEISCQGWTPGYTFGLHWKPEDWFSAGLVYRGKSELTVRGDADFDRGPNVNATLAAMIGSGVPAQVAAGTFFDAGLRDTDVQGTEPIPGSATMGLMFRPMDDLTVELDVTRTFWSAYKKLVFNYDNVLNSQGFDKNWVDTWRWQLGVEYSATDWLDLRAGYVYDQSPIPDDYVDYAVPGNDRQIVSLGAGLVFDDLTVDLSYGYLWVMDRDVEARPTEGVFDSSFTGGKTHIVGLSINYKF
ncbi:OmpP1/FadL family transporter [Desulfovibrio ferrophilus]|uniref:Membrane protein involved in aromatic hydrocarbon degradation n=1 Tax=Desulfovibrio ferrophilus TaxID=241368 RepID=A0A2Z6AV05_9BACT|nr:OmpP1/FadL family transporter [Desulfovibrio ferrophilus]BBD07016.1 membrane protein involved in aromatic hydrocarbon degradation [Desulfovibrio ferrophilus]